MTQIKTFKVYQPTITLEDGTEYNISINPKIRRFLISHKNENNKIFLNKDNIWDILKICKYYKETEMFKTIYTEIKFNITNIPYILTYKENYGVEVTWEN